MKHNEFIYLWGGRIAGRREDINRPVRVISSHSAAEVAPWLNVDNAGDLAGRGVEVWLLGADVVPDSSLTILCTVLVLNLTKVRVPGLPSMLIKQIIVSGSDLSKLLLNACHLLQLVRIQW